MYPSCFPVTHKRCCLQCLVFRASLLRASLLPRGRCPAFPLPLALGCTPPLGRGALRQSGGAPWGEPPSEAPELWLQAGHLCRDFCPHAAAPTGPGLELGCTGHALHSGSCNVGVSGVCARPLAAWAREKRTPEKNWGGMHKPLLCPHNWRFCFILNNLALEGKLGVNRSMEETGRTLCAKSPLRCDL